MTLHGDQRDGGRAAARQRSDAEHRKNGPQRRQSDAKGAEHDTDDNRSLEAVAISIAPGGQGQESLRQRKQRQQQPH